MSRLQAVANRQEKVLKIELSDIAQHFSSAREIGFVDRVRNNTTRYVSLFAQLIDEKMPPPSVEFNNEELSPSDVLRHQRIFNHQQ